MARCYVIVGTRKGGSLPEPWVFAEYAARYAAEHDAELWVNARVVTDEDAGTDATVAQLLKDWREGNDAAADRYLAKLPKPEDTREDELAPVLRLVR